MNDLDTRRLIAKSGTLLLLAAVTAAAVTMLWLVPLAHAQGKKKSAPPPSELAKLRDDFVKATNDYKASLTRLITLYQKDVALAQAQLEQSQELYSEGLISKNQLAESEAAVKAATEKVSEGQRQLENADAQIASVLLEAEAETQLARTSVGRRSLIRTTSYIRYSGSGAWNLADAWKVQRFFMDSFKKPLPIAVFGQGAIHDRWRLNHGNAMDVSLHPDEPEGQAVIGYLRANGIPFLAFRSAIPGTSTGPHIHIGRPSHRF